MPRYPQKSQYKDKDYRVIYLLRSPKTKEFFIGHCSPDSLMPTFRQHCAGDRNYTDECFPALKKEGLHPCLTILEEVFSTKVMAYRHVVAWTKIFVDAGYVSLNTGNILDYIEDLHEDSYRVYDINRLSNLSKICDCSACLVSNYARKPCALCSSNSDSKCVRPKGKPQKGTQLLIRMSEEEREQIEKNARFCNKTTSAYLRDVGCNLSVLQFDYGHVTEHTKELSTIKNAIVSLIYTMLKRQIYVPPDFEYISDKVNEMFKLEGEFLKKHNAFVDSSKKLIARTVRQTVNRNICRKD